MNKANQYAFSGVRVKGHSPLLGLAPMAGITDWPMRVLCYRMGATYACTEMVSAMGYMCAKKDNRAYRLLLETHPEESNTACQLFGSDPVVMSEATARVTELQRFTSIDLNMGCPARKITSSGEGSALLKTPELAYKLMEAVRRSTPLPVTIKTRLGYDADSMNAMALVEAAESLHLQWVCIHGRTRAQQYAGHADYAAIAAIKAKAKLPILANGDVSTPSGAVRILAETGADGLMIGRGAIGNPWLFRAAHAMLLGQASPPETLQERIGIATLHAEMMAGFKGEARGMVEMRKHVGHYMSGIRGATQTRHALHQTKTLCELKELLKAFFSQAEQEGGRKPD